MSYSIMHGYIWAIFILFYMHCSCFRYWQTCLPWQMFHTCQMWDIICSGLFPLLFFAIFLVCFLPLNIFICLLTGAPLWVPTPSYSPAAPKCEKRRKSKHRSLLKMKLNVYLFDLFLPLISLSCLINEFNFLVLDSHLWCQSSSIWCSPAASAAGPTCTDKPGTVPLKVSYNKHHVKRV